MRRGTIQAALCGALIAAATVAAYAPLRHNGFVSVDDDVYVTRNPVVLRGLTGAGAAWALTATAAANWHPLTWLSHMADVSLFGLDAAAHHRTSLAIHVANALLLLILLRRITGRLPESALVAALFALHPLHVESVAWAAERKDVLSTLLLLLALLAYARHAARPSAGRLSGVAGAFLLAAAAKPMVVTLPFLLLLLDWWPLGRHRRATPARLLLEKAPLLLICAASAAITLAAQRAGGSMGLVDAAPFGVRAAGALRAWAGYLGRALLPADLAVFYPYPAGPVPAAAAGAAALALAAVSFLALCRARRRPWLAVGWLWYVGTLVPVIGLVQVGMQASADRYTYVPLVGFFVLLVWGAAGAVRSRRAGAAALALAAATLALLGARTSGQVRLWRDSETLLRHAGAAVPGNWPAHYALGAFLESAGRAAEAAAEYRAALGIRPAFAFANSNLGRLLCLEGKVEEALPLFEQAVRSRPRSGMLQLNLGLALEATGRIGEASIRYAEAARLDPEDPVARMKARQFPAPERRRGL